MVGRSWECHVAIVDDDAGFRRALGRLIHSAGFEADAYASGAEFLDAVAEHPPACVVLDLQMPGLDGFQVQSRMARDGMHIPVIVITGSDTAESESMARKGGATAYLRKPVDEKDVLDAIRGAVGAMDRGAKSERRKITKETETEDES